MDNILKIGAGVFIAILVACAVFFLVIPQQSVQTPSAVKDTSVEGNVTVYFTGKNARIVIM
jgi:hypothetical protein